MDPVLRTRQRRLAFRCSVRQHSTNFYITCSQLQLLQVSPAGPNFDFYRQFHWEFDGVFHFMFNNLGHLKDKKNQWDNKAERAAVYLAQSIRHVEFPTGIIARNASKSESELCWNSEKLNANFWEPEISQEKLTTHPQVCVSLSTNAALYTHRKQLTRYR